MSKSKNYMYSKFFLILSLLLISATLTSCATSGKNKFRGFFNEDLAQDRESIKSGSISRAVGDLDMLLEMDPKNIEARFLRALAYQKMEQFDKAIDDYNELLKYEPKNSKAHYNLAMIYAFKVQDKKRALKHFDEFITIEPNHPRAFTAAKIMLKLDKSSKDSPQYISELIKDILTERNLERISSQSRNKRETIKKLEDAILQKPTCAKCHRLLAEALKEKKKEEEAKIHLIKAELFDPNRSKEE